MHLYYINLYYISLYYISLYYISLYYMSPCCLQILYATEGESSMRKPEEEQNQVGSHHPISQTNLNRNTNI